MTIFKLFLIMNIIKTSHTPLNRELALDTWDDAESSLNHTAGFQKFADLVIDNNAVGIVTTADIEISTVVDLIGEESLIGFPDYDVSLQKELLMFLMEESFPTRLYSKVKLL